jgi:biopolymer transport protein ExbD
MAAAAGNAGTEVMMEINTTPLIDIMLVLLIMFLVTIPIQTHAVKADLPQSPPTPNLVDRVKNKVVIEPDGAILWNGTPVTRVELRQYLELSKAIRPAPELHLQPDARARYQVVDEVLAITKRADVEAMGFVGNEAYARF